jgi:hypothetical protein
LHPPHGTNLESLFLDARENATGQTPLDGIRLDDRQRPLNHPAIISAAT